MAGTYRMHKPTKRQHIIGSTFAILVAIIWVISSELVQMVFDDSSFKKPYFVTYYSLAAFVVCLLGFVKKSWRASWSMPPAQLPGSEPQYVQLQNIDSPPGTHASARVRFTLDDEAKDDDVETPNGSAEETDHSEPVPLLNAWQVFHVALTLGPVFFLADWIYTIGLEMTSVASASTIATLSTLFTLLIGACIGVETFSLIKLFAAVFTTVGVYIISYADGKSSGSVSALGDLVNVLSAFVYAVYTTYLKKKTGPPGTLSVAMLFGFNGLVVLIGAIPGFILLHLTKLETFELPPPKATGILLVNSLIGTVLSDYLWAKSIVLTTPMIGTLALSLTVPLSVIYDGVFKSIHFSFAYLLGAGLVLFGFALVNLDEILLRRAKRMPVEDHEDSDG